MTTAATTAAQPSSAEAGRGASTTGGRPETAASRAAGAAAAVDPSAAAQRQIAQRGTGAAGRVRSLDEIVQARTKALAGTLTERLTRLGVPQDEPIVLRLDDLGQVKTDSPYREGIETLFRETPELKQAFRDVAARNVMKAAQTAFEAFAAEAKAARDDAARSAASGRYTTRLMTSQALAGTMTLSDGDLHAASVAFMDAAVGDGAPARASRRAEQVAAKRVALTA